MKSTRVTQHGYSLELFLPEAAHTAVFYLPGLPYSLGDNSAIRLLADLGVGTVFLQPSGSYDSRGRFSPRSHVALLLRVERDLLRGCVDVKGNRVHPIKIGGLVYLHKLGTVAALKFLRQRSIKFAVLFAPIIGYAPRSGGVKENLAEQATYVRRSRPRTFRLSSTFRLLRESRLPESIRTQARLMAVVGDADETFDVGRLEAQWNERVDQDGEAKRSLCGAENMPFLRC